MTETQLQGKMNLLLKAVAVAKIGRRRATLLRILQGKAGMHPVAASALINLTVSKGLLHVHHQNTAPPNRMICLTDKGRTELESAAQEGAP